MGRPITTASGLPLVAVTLRLDPTDLARVVELAKEVGMTAPTWMRAAVTTALVHNAVYEPPTVKTAPIIRGQTEPLVAGAGRPKREKPACEHPRSARRSLGYATTCGDCGVKIR